MKTIRIHIKKMVCRRCIMIIRDVFTKKGIEIHELTLGFANVSLPLEVSLLDIDQILNRWGFELLKTPDEKLVELIKIKIIKYLDLLSHKQQPENLSSFLEKEVGESYSSLSKKFKEFEQKSIEVYILRQKIEMIKEWIEYKEFNLSEIADMLGYSSSQYLSTQFRRVTGVTPSQYQKNKSPSRKGRDKI